MQIQDYYVPSDENAEAFVHLGSTTTMPTFHLYSVAEGWAERARNHAKNNTVLTAKALCQAQWSWPAFDEMVDELLSEDLWPTPWHHYAAKIKAGAELSPIRAKIFVQTARTVAMSLSRCRDFDFMLHVKREGWHLYTDSDVGAHFLQRRLDHRLLLSDWRTWPPLYPGDLSRLQVGLSGIYTLHGKFFGLGAKRPFWA